MPPPRRFLQALGCIILLVTLFVTGLYLLGWSTPVHSEGSITANFGGKQSELWEMLNDIDGVQKRRPKVIRVERLGTTVDGLPLWREYVSETDFIEFEMTQRVPMSLMTNRTRSSTVGITGELSYSIEKNGALFIMYEKSDISDTFLRALVRIRGRNAILREELRILADALGVELEEK